VNDFLKFFLHIRIIIYIIEKLYALDFCQQFKIVHELRLALHNLTVGKKLNKLEVVGIFNKHG